MRFYTPGRKIYHPSHLSQFYACRHFEVHNGSGSSHFTPSNRVSELGRSRSVKGYSGSKCRKLGGGGEGYSISKIRLCYFPFFLLSVFKPHWLLVEDRIYYNVATLALTHLDNSLPTSLSIRTTSYIIDVPTLQNALMYNDDDSRCWCV